MSNNEYREKFGIVRTQVKAEWDKCGSADRSPFVLDQRDNCRVCLPLQQELNSALESYPIPGGERPFDLLFALVRTHSQIIHEPIKSIPAQYLDKFIYPKPEEVRGVQTFYDPEETTGVTDFSKAFFILNGHRLGRIQSAEAVEQPNRIRSRFDHYTLYINGENNRRIALSGCNTGYGGEGPNGALFILRLAGFPEHVIETETTAFSRQETDLERIVYNQKSFTLNYRH